MTSKKRNEEGLSEQELLKRAKLDREMKNMTGKKLDAKGELVRRDFLRIGVQAAAVVPLLSILPACSGPEPKPKPKPKVRPKDAQDEIQPEKFDKAKTVAFDPKSVQEDKVLFPLGIQAGAMTTSQVLLWSFANDAKPKVLRVWRKSSTKEKISLVYEKEAKPVEKYFRIKVKGLAPGTLYSYAFFEGKEKRTVIGQFTTAWTKDSLKPITIAATVCTAPRFRPWTSLLTMAKYDYDLFLHLGDYSYNDGARTREQYRKKWQRTIKDPGYQAVLPKAGMYVTWDDHEIVNDSRLDDLDPKQKKDAIAAFFEHTVAERVDGDRFWTSYRWGKTAEFIVLDSRSDRVYESRSTDEAIYLGKKQMAWFKKVLKDSPCHFKVVLNSVPITDFSKSLMGEALEADRWQGYPQQRKEILDYIEDNKLKNVWWLSGDVHLGAVCKIAPEGPHSKRYEILVGPGGNLNPLWPFYKVGTAKEKERYFPKKQFPFFNGEFAATIMTFDPWKNTVAVKFVDHKSQKVIFEKTLTDESSLS